MATKTIKVGGIPEDLLEALDRRVESRHSGGRSAYIRELIRRDVEGERPKTLRDILDPADSTPEDDAEIGEFVDELIATVRSERRERAAGDEPS